MEINPLLRIVPCEQKVKKAIKRVFLIALFFLFIPFQSYAVSSSIQYKMIKLQSRSMTVSELLQEIEKQTNFLCVYSNNELNTTTRITIKNKQVQVRELLKAITQQADLRYEITNQYIVLSKTKTNESDKSFSSEVGQQKGKKISGCIKDEKGNPLIGVSVMIKNSSVGTITDLDGNFKIEADPDDVLQISYVGYVTRLLKAGNSHDHIILKEDSKILDEVVVVGYGTTTKRSMIASVASVKSEQLNTLPVSNITQGLAGRAAGLIVQGSGGGINKQQTISIRGGGTPLVVIDGIIRNYNDFTQLASEDIESLSVLKDASATAVYGSRASDGIIQVTTKRGKESKPQVEYNFNYSLSEPSYWKKPMSSWRRAEYANIAKENDGLEGAFSQERINKMKDGSDPLQNNNTQWRDLVLNNFAPQSKHSLRVVGGTEINNYYISLSHIDQDSFYKNNNHWMKRTNFRLSQSVLMKNIGLKTVATIDGYVQKTTHPYTSTASSPYHVFGHIQDRSPLIPGVNSFGLPYSCSDNPVAETASDTGYQRTEDKMINGNLSLEWEVPWVSGLKVRAIGNYRYGFVAQKQWRKDAAKYDWESQDPKYDNTPLLYNSTSYGYHWTNQLLVDYKKTMGKHTLVALGGYEASYARGNYYWLQRENYQFPIDQIGVGPESTQKNGGSESESGRAAWIGQVKYNFDNKYFVEGSLRYDGSDNFPEDKRWGTFFSGSLGWSVTDEAFMERLVEKNILNSLKARMSYGQVGLDNWGDSNNPFHIGRFSYLQSYNLDNKAWVLNGAYVPGFSEGAIPSPDISWFTTDQFDLGFDFASLNNRLYGSVDYFYYRTKGFLYAPNQADVGYTDPLGMALPKVSTKGEHRRAGFDFTLGWRDSYKDFKYDVSANFTKFDQLWANKPDEAISDVMNPFKRSSQQVGFYGNLYQSLGYYKDANDVYNSVKRLGSKNLTSGDLKYQDFNGDGKLDGADQIRLGKSSFPRANYGININLSYKGFFFSTLFQGATRFDLYLSGTASMNGGQTGELPVIYDYQTDFWTPDNRHSSFPRLMSSPGLNGNNNYVGSDFWLINGAYFRMKDFTLGYDFKQLLLRKVNWLSKATLALSGQNLFTLSETTKYGLDPENASVEHYGYPNERVYALSVSLGF